MMPEWEIMVKPGMRVSAGSSVIARRREFAGVDLAEARKLVPEARELVHAQA